MENQEIKNNGKSYGKKVVGIAILTVGLVLLAKELGLNFPAWVLSWPMLLIVIGIANGFKHQFKNSGWLIMILIGSVFLVEKIEPDLSVLQYTWPLILIGLGLWFLFGRKNQNFDFNKNNSWKESFKTNSNNGYHTYTESTKNDEPVGENKKYQTTGDEYIEAVSVFGGTKKNVLSKNFKGGEIVSILGGAEINLAHADINGTVILEVVQILGGTKIIVPPTWNVTSEMTTILGGIDDKRALNQVLTDGSKVLLIKGTSILGGIDIRNF
jgi:predicted membrane protein